MLGWETLSNKLSIQTFNTDNYNSSLNSDDELTGASDPNFEAID